MASEGDHIREVSKLFGDSFDKALERMKVIEELRATSWSRLLDTVNTIKVIRDTETTTEKQST